VRVRKELSSFPPLCNVHRPGAFYGPQAGRACDNGSDGIAFVTDASRPSEKAPKVAARNGKSEGRGMSWAECMSAAAGSRERVAPVSGNPVMQPRAARSTRTSSPTAGCRWSPRRPRALVAAQRTGLRSRPVWEEWRSCPARLTKVQSNSAFRGSEASTGGRTQGVRDQGVGWRSAYQQTRVAGTTLLTQTRVREEVFPCAESAPLLHLGQSAARREATPVGSTSETREAVTCPMKSEPTRCAESVRGGGARPPPQADQEAWFSSARRHRWDR